MAKKPYVQFSKKMVVFVCAAVTAICVAGVALCGFYLNSSDGVVSIISSYIGYAMVCFAAYSGNSAVEKWLVYTAKGKSKDDESDDDSSSNG